MTHLGANVSDDLARLSGKVEDAFAYADGAVSKNIGKHNARVYQSNGGNWDEVASGILGGSGAGRKAAAEFSDDANQALAKHGDEVSQALKETGEQSGKRASAEFGGEASQALAKHGDEVSQALKETGEQAGKHASAEFGGEAVENSIGHNNTVSDAFQNSPEVHWDGTKWESHTDDIHRKMLEDNVPLTSEVHTIDEIAKQQAEILKVQNGEEALSTNLKKGNFGEMVQDEYYRQFGYDRISKDMVTDLGEENSIGHNNTVSDAFQNSPEVHWDGTKWESHTDDIHRKMLEDNVPLTSEVHTIDEIAKQQAEILKVQNGEEALSTNLKKGNFGEMVQDEYYRQFGYDRISKDMVTDLGEGGHQGIDGVYYNPNGHPPYIIAEAKYNTSRLSKGLADGTDQMDYEWIDKRLEQAVGEEHVAAIQDAVEFGDVQSHLFNLKQGGHIIINQLDDMAKKIK